MAAAADGLAAIATKQYGKKVRPALQADVPRKPVKVPPVKRSK